MDTAKFSSKLDLPRRRVRNGGEAAPRDAIRRRSRNHLSRLGVPELRVERNWIPAGGEYYVTDEWALVTVNESVPGLPLPVSSL